jgi:hypothetical protein
MLNTGIGFELYCVFVNIIMVREFTIIIRQGIASDATAQGRLILAMTNRF